MSIDLTANMGHQVPGSHGPLWSRHLTESTLLSNAPCLSATKQALLQHTASTNSPASCDFFD